MVDPAPDLEHPAFRPLDVQHVRDAADPGIVLVDRLGLAEPTFVPKGLLPVVGQFDGVRDIAGVCRAAGRQLGEPVPEVLVRSLVQQLDERLLLATDRYRRRLDAAVRDFLQLEVRPPRHAGSAGYAADPGKLRGELLAMVGGDAAAGGPAPRGLIAPHIDLDRGRAGYAAAYGALLPRRPADLYVVFGTGHLGPSAPVTGLSHDWQTPLGRAATDRAFVAAVHGAIGEPQPFDRFLHRDEHALEFQVLLLQHLHERRGDPPPRIAGFLCGSLPSAAGDPGAERYVQRLLQAFRAAAGDRRVCWLAGADLAHCGPAFGDRAPVGQALLARLDADERQRLSMLQRGEPGGFHAAVVAGGNPDRVCSATAIYLTAALAGGGGELLHYGQAAAADGSQVVTFPALLYG